MRHYCHTIVFNIAILSLILGSGYNARGENSHREFYETHRKLAGLYETTEDRIIIGQIPDADIIYFERLSTGDMRFMAEDGDRYVFRYSPTRNSTALTEGQIAFHANRNGEIDSLTWTVAGTPPVIARRAAGHTEEIQFANGEEASLRGSLTLPAGEGPFPAVVVIPQGDRTDTWDVGMWLYSCDLAVLVYDQRNNEIGRSVGKEVTGRYQERQQVYAGDAAAAVRYLQSRDDINAAQVGVVGWSGGGFIGAMVAGLIPQLAFYVNIAGDASPGFEQASHMFVARLMREGFTDAEVDAGRRFVNLHFGVAEGRTAWEDYQAELEIVRDTDWYQFLSKHYSIPYTRKEGITEIGRFQSEWPPERVYGKVSSVPSLGVFFEFDQSSAPSSPVNFYESLRAAGNGDVAIVMIPDTHHGGFVLDGMEYRFDTSQLRRRSPLLIASVIDWVARHVHEPPRQ